MASNGKPANSGLCWVAEGGKLGPASQTARLVKALKAPSHLALSGRTMEFDGAGKCVAGC